MAQITGPLFSQQAKGKISGAITYFSRNGQAQVTGLKKPKKKRSPAQETNQGIFGDGQQAWKDLSDEDKAFWEEDARIHNDEHPNWKAVSGRCLFMTHWMIDHLP